MLAGILVLVGAILIGKSVFGGSDGGSSDVPVPQLVGKTLRGSPGRSRRTRGVKVAQSGTERCDQPKGSICSQTPAEGGKMKQGETVQVVVSEGAPKVEVPDVTEKSRAKAEDDPDGQGLQGQDRGDRVRRGPGHGARAGPQGRHPGREGLEVTLTVAKQSKVNVPPVVGQQFDAAKSQLETLGFTVARVDVDSDQPAGRSSSRTPAGNSKAAKGATVTLQVSKGPQQTAQVPHLFNKTIGRGQAAPRPGRSAARHRRRSERRQGPGHRPGPGGRFTGDSRPAGQCADH